MALYLTIQSFNRKKIPMMLRPIKESVLSLVFIKILIFATKKVRIMVLVRCFFMSSALALCPPECDSGSAKNTQIDFLILVEDAIKTLDASNGPVKYQDAIEKKKTRLDFAIAQGVLLMPSRMIINTESIVGCNNNLTRVTDDMDLGVNNHINLETRKSSLKPMAGGPSKINPPNSHPSNPIHKKATEAQGLVKKKPPTTQTPATDTS